MSKKKSQFLNEVATGEAGHENKIELLKWCHSQKHCEKLRVDKKNFEIKTIQNVFFRYWQYYTVYLKWNGKE